MIDAYAVSEPPLHEHEWRLASVEDDGHVQVREFVCLGCPEVLIGE